MQRGPRTGRGDDGEAPALCGSLEFGRPASHIEQTGASPPSLHLYRLPVAGKRADDECREDAPRARLPSSAHPLVAMRRTAGTLGAVKRTDVAGALEGDRMGVHAVAQPLLGE